MTAREERLGPYVLGPEIGRGGQAVVYAAVDERLGRAVALKRLLWSGPGAEDAVRRFRREAEIAARLQHPHICGVLDAGIEAGIPYLVMPLLRGETFAARLRRLARNGRTEPTPSTDVVGSFAAALASELPPTERATVTPTPTREVPAADLARRSAEPATAVDRGGPPAGADLDALVLLVEKTARAVHAAHEAGVVHRDLKPGNVMIVDEEPVVLDFGLARADDGGPGVTATGDQFGTPAYMAPELIARGAAHVDRRADVYALGVTLFEAATLTRPFEGPTREALFRAVLKEPAPDPRRRNPAVSGDLAVVVAAALEKDPARRYATALALADDLRAVLERRPVAAKPVGPVGRAARFARREPALAGLFGSLLVGLPVVTGLVANRLALEPTLAAGRRAELDARREAGFAVGFFHLLERRYEAALAAFDAAAALGGDPATVAAGRAFAELGRGRAEEVLKSLDARPHPLAGRRAAAELRCSALRDLGRRDEAVAALRDGPPATDEVDRFVEGFRYLEESARGRPDGPAHAKDSLLAAIALSPVPRAALYQGLAEAARRLEDAAAGDVAATALVRYWPESAVARLHAGTTWALTGAPDRGARELERALALDPALESARVNLGVAHYYAGRYADAERVLAEAAEKDPRSHEALFNRGLALDKLGRADDAIAAWRKAADLAPQIAAYRRAIGVALEGLGEPGEAADEYRAAVAAAPRDPELRVRLGAASQREGNLAAAEAAFRGAVAVAPQDAEAHRRLAAALGARGRLAEAVAEARAAAELAPADPGCAYALSQALLADGRFEEAVAAAAAAGRLDPRASEPRAAEEEARRALADDAATSEIAAATRPVEAAARRLARDALRVALTARAAALRAELAAAASDEARTTARRGLRRLLRRPDCADYRDDGLARLDDPAERAAWAVLWTEIAAALGPEPPAVAADGG